MSDHTSPVLSTPGVIPEDSRVGRNLQQRGYFTIETVAMWIAYVATIAGNAIIEGGRVGGVTSATVAYDVFTWFTPAGYVFSIWTLIYVALAVWLVAYTRLAPTRPKRFGLVSVLFIVSCVLNVLWLALWHFQLIGVSFVVIAVEWVVLFVLYLSVRRTAKSWMEWVPLSIYAAWMTVATLANLAIVATRGFGDAVPFFGEASTLVLSVGVLVFGYVMRKVFDDVAFPLVFLWALVGVGVHVLGASLPLAIAIFLLCAAGAVLTFVPFKRLRSLARK